MYQVTKTIHFCYGHRLLRYEGKCRFLHGHNARVEITLARPQLDPRGMVTDFNEIRLRLKRWIDETLDHKMLLHREDPIIPQLKAAQEPFVPIPENPTAEVLARLIFEQARSERFPVTSVRLWETDSSFATYAPSP